MPLSTPPPAPAGLDAAIDRRYAPLAGAAGSLSCGGALDLAALRPGEHLVDLGCGRGGDVVRAAALVGDQGLAVGVDASEAMLAVARERAAAAPRARFVRGDLASIPLPSGRADVVISNCAINHAPDKAAVYREIHRLLRPGGRCVVSDVVAETVLPEAVRSDPDAWAACYGGAIPEADYLAAIAASGLGGIEVLRRTEPYERGGVRIRSLTLLARRPQEAP
jgi:arsenite methyltransferase